MARWYDSEIGHFIQADTIVPGVWNPLAWDRYSYVNYNPLAYTDPSGHADIVCPNGQCADSGQGTVEYYQDLMYGLFNFVFENTWAVSEMKDSFTVSWRILNLMGGSEIFKKRYGNKILTFDHYVPTNNSIGHYLPDTNRIEFKIGFSLWTIAHELGHAFSYSTGRIYETGLRNAVGAGRGEWWKKARRSKYPDDEAYWYDPGDSPPVNGANENFNASEDFAESFAAAVLPEDALDKNVENIEPSSDYYWADQGSFYNTPRGQYMLSILCP